MTETATKPKKVIKPIQGKAHKPQKTQPIAYLAHGIVRAKFTKGKNGYPVLKQEDGSTLQICAIDERLAVKLFQGLDGLKEYRYWLVYPYSSRQTGLSLVLKGFSNNVEDLKVGLEVNQFRLHGCLGTSQNCVFIGRNSLKPHDPKFYHFVDVEGLPELEPKKPIKCLARLEGDRLVFTGEDATTQKCP